MLYWELNIQSLNATLAKDRRRNIADIALDSFKKVVVKSIFLCAEHEMFVIESSFFPLSLNYLHDKRREYCLLNLSNCANACFFAPPQNF